ncbi:SHOCT domain-containing protein [Nocardiopsis coralliicola]
MSSALAAAVTAAPAWAGHGPPPFAPLIGVAMLCLILLIALLAFLVLRSRGHRPPWARGPAADSPDDTARRVLAERFANGDLTVEEFLERASALNWVPGRDTKGRT